MAKRLRFGALLLLVAALAAASMACKLLNRLSDRLESGTPSRPSIQTAAGTLVVTDVQISDKFPPDCSSTPDCLEARDGYQIVIVWLEKPGGGSVGDISDKLFGEAVNYLGEKDSQAYLTSGGGDRCGFASIRIFEDKFGLAFGSPQGVHGFTLTWPGNDPLQIGE